MEGTSICLAVLDEVGSFSAFHTSEDLPVPNLLLNLPLPLPPLLIENFPEVPSSSLPPSPNLDAPFGSFHSFSQHTNTPTHRVGCSTRVQHSRESVMGHEPPRIMR